MLFVNSVHLVDLYLVRKTVVAELILRPVMAILADQPIQKPLMAMPRAQVVGLPIPKPLMAILWAPVVVGEEQSKLHSMSPLSFLISGMSPKKH